MSPFDRFLKNVTSDAQALAKTTLKTAAASALTDTQAFLRESESDLREWTRQLKSGELRRKEFENLVEGQKELAKLHALTRAGVALAEIDRFRDALIELVINAAFKTFLP